jgi:uncharacterized protein
MKRIARIPKALAAAGALCLVAGTPAGCLKTATPDEEYGQPGGSPGSGGSTQAGKGATGNATAGGAGGESAEAGAGGSPSDAGAGGQGGEQPPAIECGPAPVSAQSFSLSALRQAAASCANWHYCRFENAATALASRVSAHADARSTASLYNARDAFREAMESWSVVELFQFGPLSSAAEAAGKDGHAGQGIRDLVYSWRSVARCRVEEQVALEAYADGMDGVLISGRGLYALEYLLFYPGADSACAAATPTGQSWAGLGSDELLERKLRYATAVADDVFTQVQTLRGIWDPAAGNFQRTFASASAPYPSEQDAMTALGWALLYVEKELKDWKLGMRIGKIEGDLVAEVPFAAATAGFEELPTENIRRNLRGFRALFQGCGEAGQGLGFDDWLNEAGHAELAADVIAAWQAAQEQADDFPPLETATSAEVEALYESLRVLSNLLKTELFGTASVLGLKLPTSVGSDTD